MVRKLRTIEMQRLSVEQFREAEKLPLVVVLDDVRSLYNVGSVFRTCDAFRVEAVYLCGITATPDTCETEIHKTALGAESAVAWKHFDTADEAVRQLKADGYLTLAVEQAEGSIKAPLPDLADMAGNSTTTPRYAIVLGNEVRGVHQSVIDLTDACLEIPQYGTKHSMNVAVTAGIVIWEFARQLYR